MLQVKNVKSFVGMEGHGFNCSLYIDGKKVAFVIDEANGGEFHYQWDGKTPRERSENEKAVQAVTQTISLSMAPSSIFRAVRSILNDANITGPRACGQTLRNSYAASLITLGFDDQQLTDALGLYELVSAVRLRNAWTTFHGRNFITPPSSF